MSVTAVKRLLLACSLFPLAAAAAQLIGTVTLLEGSASMLRGTARYAAAEGVRLERGDILELGDKSLAQVEFADGTMIDLGPHSRLLALYYPGRATASGGGELFLLQGWMKLSRPKADPRVIVRFGTPCLELNTVDGVAVVQASESDTALYMEAGEGRVAAVTHSGHTEEPIRLKTSQFYSCKADQRGIVAQRAAHTFVTAMPRSFMDTLPSRLARFKDRSVAPRRTSDFTYADVQSWMKTTAPVRRAVATQWQGKVRDPAFRNAVAANLKDHPEWDRLLHPEQYETAHGSKPEGPGGSEGK